MKKQETISSVARRTAKVRVIRDGIVIYTGKLGSLRRFKDDVKEVTVGQDCGLNIESYNDIKVGDIITAVNGKPLDSTDILLEVNIGDEDSKTGFDKIEFEESLNQISLLPNIKVKGLMTIPPICENALELEKYFDRMSSYYNEIKEGNYPNFDFKILSMGMSGDYKEAVLHGSNLVRVGSAIFGARIYK